MRLLHLSDPHLGTHNDGVADALVALAWELAPQALLISGDLTQRATPAQFEAARRWLDRLPEVPRLVVPGNHDISLWNLWERWRHPYARFERVCGPRPVDGVSCLDAAGVRVVAVDTTRWWRHRHGTLSGDQIDATARLLADAPAGTWRIVMSHHPLAVARRSDREDRPWRHRAALSAWQAAGADLLLSGHLHDPALIAVGTSCWVAQAGSSISRRLRPGVRNSVQLLVDRAPVVVPGTEVRAGLWLAGVHRRCLRFDHDPATQAFRLAADWSLQPRDVEPRVAPKVLSARPLGRPAILAAG